jgi:hypothetical protein
MAAITGFVEHPENPAWVSLTFDDGSQSPFAQDPDGSYRREAADIARKIMGEPPRPMAGALASNAPAAPAPLAGNPLAMPIPGGPGGGPAMATDVPAPSPLGGNPLAMPAPAPAPVAGTPEALAAPGQPFIPKAPTVLAAPTPEQARELQRQQGAFQGELDAGMSQQKAAEARKAEAAASRVDPANPGYRIVETPGGSGISKSETIQTSGLNPADKKRVDAANADATQAQYEADQAALRARTEQVNAEWARLSDQEKAKLAEEAARKREEQEMTERVDTQTRKLEEITSRPIDPSKAFAGDAGWYAFMAGFGDSIQNFGAALAGRGPVANPGATIDRMIARSVALQTEQMEQEFKAGRITADQLTAEREHVRAQLSAVGKQLADTQLSKARTEEEKLGLGAMGQKFEADRKAAKNAAATARSQQTSVTTQVTPTAPGGPSLFLGEKPDWDGVKAHSEKNAGADQVERGVSRLEKAAGWTWDEKQNNGAGGYVGADGKPVTANSADPAGISILGSRFSTGEAAREVNGALEDIAAGGAKVKDPVGAVSDKSVDAEKNAMAAGTDEGLLRAAERTRRNLRGMRAGIDAGFSPGVVNAARYRKDSEQQFRANQPGLPKSRAATPEDLRK